MRPYRDLTDEEWDRVMPLLPELRPRQEARGRPLVSTRAVLNGVLWIMFSGASWAALPRKYPSYQTCHRRFKVWYDSGVLAPLTRELFGPAGDALFASMSARMRGAKGSEAAVAPRAEACLPAVAEDDGQARADRDGNRRASVGEGGSAAAGNPGAAFTRDAASKHF